MKRRAFLQQVGLLLTTLGIGEVGLRRSGDRYRHALAQSAPRKLALLIGINHYSQIPTLSGCVTDVELQRELLIHRFGFRDRDILTLTDQQATRQNIESAFMGHLTDQVQPGDVVVFHFSGYGSRVVTRGDMQNSLVPVDSEIRPDAPQVNDLPEETLWLLLRSLRSDRVTTVLDTSYISPENGDTLLRSNLRLRARPTSGLAESNPAVLMFQEQLLSQLNISKSQTRIERQSGQIPGVVLAAAGEAHGTPPGKAFEARWSGFSSGLLTYALTQYLWEATPANTLQMSFRGVSSLVEQLAGQEEQPGLSGQKSQERSLLTYYLPPEPLLGADGVVTAVEEGGKVGRLWLAGLPAIVLESYSPNSLLTLLPGDQVDSKDTASTRLQISARNGLIAKVRICCGQESQLEVGQYVREAVRVLPRQINLMVALDPTMERIERVDATSAFSGIAQIKAVTAADQPTDCLFGKVKPIIPSPLPAESPPASAIAPPPGTVSVEGTATPPPLGTEVGKPLLPQNHYGLFSPGYSLIPNTVSARGEVVKVAVQRVLPQLHTLLAAKLLRLTANSGSSYLGVRATLEMVVPEEQMLIQQETVRGVRSPSPEPAAQAQSVKPEPNKTEPAKMLGTGLPRLSIGNRIRYRLYNDSDRPVYFMVLGLDSSGTAIALYPGQSQETPEAKSELHQNLLAPGEAVTVPQVSTAFEWVIREPVGINETQIIFSTAPFTQTLMALKAGGRSMGNIPRISVPTNPLEVAQAVLQDLHQASLGFSTLSAPPADVFALDMRAWATLSFIYQVV
ncbi:hypothetical protein BST81_04960 [Leptolyngbya sp. 'hensonii']|nr:hypothetical protein BST81_04960 [Leptolyngbya sp. 'hensonii']